jgi:hypothetical protein
MSVADQVTIQNNLQITGRKLQIAEDDLQIAAAANRQLEQELGEAVAALRALCRATGDESEDEGLAIWLRADEICALHDEETT